MPNFYSFANETEIARLFNFFLRDWDKTNQLLLSYLKFGKENDLSC